MRRMVQAAVWLVLAGMLAGCATTGERSGPRRDYNVITAEEIAEVEDQVRNLYQLVERLRPRWLEARSPRSMGGFAEIVVYQGQSLLGDASQLRQFGPEFANWMEYLDASQAVARFAGLSNRSIGGAIVIHLSPPR